MRLPIYNSVTMGMGWGLFLLVQTPQSAQRSHDRRVVIGASDMGWGNLSPTPFSLASIDCILQTKRPCKNSQPNIHYGVGLGRGEGREERELELDGFMLFKPQTTVKITNVRVFYPTCNRRIWDEIFNGKLFPAPPSKNIKLHSVRIQHLKLL